MNTATIKHVTGKPIIPQLEKLFADFVCSTSVMPTEVVMSIVNRCKLLKEAEDLMDWGRVDPHNDKNFCRVKCDDKGIANILSWRGVDVVRAKDNHDLFIQAKGE